MKKIIVAKSAGFCFGVSRSVSMAEKLLEEGKAYSLGPLIHNNDVVAYLEKKGLSVIDTPEQLPSGGRVIIRSHGISKEVYGALEEKTRRCVMRPAPR